MNLRLIWQDPNSGEHIEQSYPPPLALGRELDNDVVIPSVSVSRHHAKIELEDGERLIITDLGSSNGTYVNGERIDAPTVISDGETIILGKVEMTVKLTAERTRKPSRDFLFDALSKGEAEPTVTLASLSQIDKSALFSDLDSPPPVESTEPIEKISGDALKDLLMGHLSKDMTDHMATSNITAQPQEPNGFSKLVTSIRRFLGI